METATLDVEVDRFVRTVEGSDSGSSLADSIDAVASAVSAISSVTAAQSAAQLQGPSLYAAWLLALVQPQGPLDSLPIGIASPEELESGKVPQRMDSLSCAQ